MDQEYELQPNQPDKTHVLTYLMLDKGKEVPSENFISPINNLIYKNSPESRLSNH